jgi:CxxC motif-containing protein (DUF1111 family)
MKKLTYTVLAFSLAILACESLLPPLPADEDLLDGPLSELTPEQNAQFLAGDVAFNDEVFTPETGLGPYFVATSCGSCHAGDGKGHPFTTLTRYGQAQADSLNVFAGLGGPQLQNRAIPGLQPEQLPPGAAFARFMPPANTGLGLLAALTDAQILALADPNDADGDGISGRPNYIVPPDYFQPQWFHQPINGRYIGRFGKKAGAIDLLHQTVNAYVQDMGVTSDFAPDEPGVFGVANPIFDQAPDPEVPRSTVNNVVFYLRTLKVPIQRNPDRPDVAAGRQLFLSINCGKCHVPEWTTPASDIAALGHQTFYPYTDLLLHDMGPGLDDGYTEGSAQASEWRTPPLWGLGLAANSQGGEVYFLHDGRARTIEEAILLHGGEADDSRQQYTELSPAEQQQLRTFLESL